MNKNMEKLHRWLAQPEMPQELKGELAELLQSAGGSDAEKREAAILEINDRFYRELEFGTGGLRGVLGAGTNRMNIYTVGKATRGVARYIQKHFERQAAAIGYDSRRNSELFANVAADLLRAEGIDVYLYDTLMPAPALSFATRYHKCAIGIMITASHNPAIYNGYKVYNHQGCQVTSEAAEEILEYIQKTDIFAEPGNKIAGKLVYMKEETKKTYYDTVEAEKMRWADEAEMRSELSALSVVYTPLCGAGNLPVRELLSRIGVGKVHVIPEQERPDGDFPTCPYPNPEKREAMELGLAMCSRVKPDLLLATDPDCDRLGIAVRDGEEYILLSGNEVGILLLDFICRMRREGGVMAMPANPYFARTIVSSKLTDRIAERYGVLPEVTLTGFKYIGETIAAMESVGRESDFIFGFEESCGYLSGTYVRDKDAVNAATLVCQMAAYDLARGTAPIRRLRGLYEEHGYYVNDLLEFMFPGESGMRRMDDIMEALRKNPPDSLAGQEVSQVTDYQTPVGGLPASNVLAFDLIDGSSVICRPSGTEPKLKIYLSARAASEEGARGVIRALSEDLTGKIERI